MTKPIKSTFRFDQDVKDAFRHETYLRGITMTEALETFMINYVKLCRHGKGT